MNVGRVDVEHSLDADVYYGRRPTTSLRANRQSGFLV